MTIINVRHRVNHLRAVQWTGYNGPEIEALFANFERLADEDRVGCDDPEATAQAALPPHYNWTLVYTGDWFVEHGDAWKLVRGGDFGGEYEAVDRDALVTARRLAMGTPTARREQ